MARIRKRGEATTCDHVNLLLEMAIPMLATYDCDDETRY
jgi:hypothetical protein